MATSLNKAVRFGIGGTVTFYTASNPATPVNTGPITVGALQSLSATHEDEVIEVKDSNGLTISTVAANNDRIAVEFTALLSADTANNAALSGSLPYANGFFKLTGCPVIKMGPWSDALNVSSSGSAPDINLYVYTGGGKVQLNNDGTATFTASGKRYTALPTSSGAISV